VRLVRQLRREPGASQGTVQRVAHQLGYGVESVRSWVGQADIGAGIEPGSSSSNVPTDGTQPSDLSARALMRPIAPFRGCGTGGWLWGAGVS
jgi:transposase-like protein